LAEDSSSFLTGGKVQSWADRSGNANTLTQATSSKQPSYLTGGGLSFDGTDDFLSASMPTSLSGNPGLTLFIVGSTNDTGSKRIFQLGDGAFGSAKLIGFNPKGTLSYNNSGALGGSYNFFSDSTIGVWRRTSTDHTGEGDYFLNGTKKGLTANSSDTLNIPSNGSIMMLAKAQGLSGNTSSTNYLNVDIQEVMLFSSDLPDYTIKRMEGYLAHKWGSTGNLPSGHPFKSTAPDFGGSQTIVTSGNTIPVVSNASTLSMDIGLFRLEDYGCYATSGLPLSYSTSNASVLDVDTATGKLDPKGAGTATITLSQAGDSHFSAASSVTLNITISEDRSQTIDFPSIADFNASSSAQTYTLGATASSGLTVTYTSSDTSKATISGSTMTIAANALGTISITASQSGGTDPSNSNITYLAAESITQTFSVSKADQFITFDALPDRNITDGTTFTLSATASSNLSVTFESNDTNILTISGTTATIKDEGAVSITASQAGNDTFNPASKSRAFNLFKKDQTITFAAIADTNTTVTSITPSATASSGLTVTFESNDTSVVSASGSTLNINGGGNVTITAKQLGNIAWRAATPVTQSFFVKLVGRPLTVLFDGGGTMGTSETFKARVTLKDGNTGRVVDPSVYTSISISYSVTNSVTGTTNASVSGNSVSTGTGSGSFTVTASVTDTNSITAKRYVPRTASITVTVDSSKAGQSILVSDGKPGSFGLRDLPLSRRPISIGKMFKSSSDLPITFSLANNSSGVVKLIDNSGADAKLGFSTASDGFSGFGSGKELTFDLIATQAGNGSYHAAQSVSRTIKIKKPSKSVFFEERKLDARYDDVKSAALTRIAAKKGISGEKALALFNSDNYDSDGDGVSNAMERVFGGDSLGQDSRGTLPAPVKVDDGKEYITFIRYNSTYQADMGVTYIVEKSDDRRTWSESGVQQVGSAVDLGGGMERVVYRTTSATAAGTTQFIRVRAKIR
jgi:hypothetical protein